MRTSGSRVVVGRRTTVGAEEGLGFDVTGSHLFNFENGKVKSLRASVSPQPD